MNVLMTWHLVTGLQPRNERTVTEKDLTNYCRVGWIRRGGTACNSSGCADFMDQGS